MTNASTNQLSVTASLHSEDHDDWLRDPPFRANPSGAVAYVERTVKTQLTKLLKDSHTDYLTEAQITDHIRGKLADGLKPHVGFYTLEGPWGLDDVSVVGKQ